MMKNSLPTWRRLMTALFAAVLGAGAAQAQGTNPSGSPYPYWATAPQSYSGSHLTVPVPGASANVSNAAHSPATSTGIASGIGGSYVPPPLTARDIGSRLPQRQSSDAESKAHIWLRVPEDAEVWVNGVKTKQTGESRYYFSPSLTPGKKYSYEMRIRWKKDGKPVEEKQSFLVRAGATFQRDFTRSDKKDSRP